MRLSTVGSLALTVALATPASGQQELEYERSEIAEGVHLFTPPDMGLGNVTAIVSEGEALVVDATGTPAFAAGIVKALRALGVEEVVALVNTHWHDDHIWGNQAFLGAYPGMPVLAHPGTIDGIRQRAVPALEGQIERLHAVVSERDSLIAARVNADGSTMTVEQREALEARQALFKDAVASLESVRPTLPDTRVEAVTRISVGNVQVTVEHVGRGHTAGDLIVRVPDRGVVIVGDLVTLPVPAATEAFVLEWTDVLIHIESMEWALLVPGHGSVMEDRLYVQAVRALFQDVEAYVRQGITSGVSVDELVEGADFADFRANFVRDDQRTEAMFRTFFVEPAIRAVYAQLAGG